MMVCSTEKSKSPLKNPVVTSKARLKNLVVRRKTTGNVIYEKPVFCDKGKYLVVPSGPSCYLYSTATGERVQELFTCNEPIITVQIHPENSSDIIAVTEKGEVIIYNLKMNEIQNTIILSLDPEMLDTCKVPKFDKPDVEMARFYKYMNKKVQWKEENLEDVKFLHAHVDRFKKIKKTVIFATWYAKDEVLGHITVFGLDGKQVPGINFKKTPFSKTGRNFVIGTVGGSKFLAGFALRSVAVAHFMDEERFCQETIKMQKHFTSKGLDFTSVAFHPEEVCFAAGDSLGRVFIFRNIFEETPIRDEYHWHYLPVRDLAFTDYGNYLFSGGEENVLVKWSLSSNHKTFLPRLTSAIYHIQVAPDDAMLAISTNDNRILITTTQLNNISTIESFTRWSGLGHCSDQGIFSLDPKTGAFVLNGRTGHVQFVTTKDEGKLLYSVDITNRNYITPDRHQVFSNTEVTHCIFTKTGRWMITAEARKDETIDCRLKFWEFNDLKQEYSLNTNIESPHDNSEVLSMEISSDEIVATTGRDEKFKLWALFDVQQLNEMKKIWSLMHVGTYRSFPCRPLDFSKDASLIAVGFNQSLTVWDLQDFKLKTSLAAPLKRDPIKHLKFGNNELSHCVVTATDYNLSSWNVISLTMMWTVPLKVSLLISDPFSNYMSCFSGKNSLFIFEPSSPSPVFIRENVTSSRVISGNFVVNPKTSNPQFYFLTADQELLCLEDGDEEVNLSSREEGSRKWTPFSAQIAESSRSNVLKKKKNPLAYSKLAVESAAVLLESPSHALPNPSLFCMEILKSLSLAVGKAKKEEDQGNDEVTIIENVSESVTNQEGSVDEEDLLRIKNKLFS